MDIVTDKDEIEDTKGEATSANRVLFVLCMVISFLLGMAAFNVTSSFYPKTSSTSERVTNNTAGTTFNLHVVPEHTAITLGQQFDTRTFSHHGLSRPPNEMLMPRLKNLTHTQASKVSEFLNLDLVKYPYLANALMSQLTTHTEIIREAQRIQFNVFEKVLGKFKYAIWFGIAAFENKGDSCVTTGEAYLMQRLGIQVVFFCHFKSCTPERLDEARKLAEKYSPDELVIVGRGGGNLVGYYHNDGIRFGILDRFPEYKVVIFPQGIWVRNDDLQAWHVQKCMRKYCCNPNLTIVLREMPSYNLARKIFNGTTQLLLAPDSAFQFGPLPRFMSPVFDILWLKRDDQEGTPNFTLPAYPSHLRVHMSQWWKWKTPWASTNIERAYYLCTNGFSFLQRAKVIITDRLHGHIISTLSNIPHVIIDPKGRKNTNFHYTWTKSINNVEVAKTPEEAMALAIRMLDKFKDVLSSKMPFLHLREGSDEEKRADAHPERLP